MATTKDYDSLSIRKSLKTRQKADRLTDLQSKLMGMKVQRPDVIDRALAEAIERAEAAIEARRQAEKAGGGA